MRVLFINDEKGQVGTTFNLIALASFMSIQMKENIVMTQTQFHENQLEYAFYESSVNQSEKEVGIDSLIRMIKCCAITKEMIDECLTNLYKNQLYLLRSTNQSDTSIVDTDVKPMIAYCVNAINEYYGHIFVDFGYHQTTSLSKLLESKDILVVNLNQNPFLLAHFFQQNTFPKEHCFYLFSNYEKNTKYSLAYLCRKYRLPLGQTAFIPHNVMFMDAIYGGQTMAFFLEAINSTKGEENYYFFSEVEKACKKLLRIMRMVAR